ncbi:MAG: spore coat associated protein CotJA, partial [Clostridia bacterium]|nr:spore coat associated protein CotJA [Clostridia bacterium]
RFENMYSLDEALCAGTLFKELDKPFLGRKAERKGWIK